MAKRKNTVSSTAPHARQEPSASALTPPQQAARSSTRLGGAGQRPHRATDVSELTVVAPVAPGVPEAGGHATMTTLTELALRFPTVASFAFAPVYALPVAPAVEAAHPAPSAKAHQAPRSARESVRAQFARLRALLAEEWEIAQPIFARPLWSSTDDSTTAFNFVLRRDYETHLVIIPDGRTVRRFIRERELLVDYRR